MAIAVERARWFGQPNAQRKHFETFNRIRDLGFARQVARELAAC